VSARYFERQQWSLETNIIIIRVICDCRTKLEMCCLDISAVQTLQFAIKIFFTATFFISALQCAVIANSRVARAARCRHLIILYTMTSVIKVSSRLVSQYLLRYCRYHTTLIQGDHCPDTLKFPNISLLFIALLPRVATHFRCDGIFNDHFIANFPDSRTVKKFQKSVNI